MVFLDRFSHGEKIEFAKKLISDYCRAEYGTKADFSDLSRIDVAYIEDDEGMPVQTYIDLVGLRLVTEDYENDVKTEHVIYYRSLTQLIEDELLYLDFDNLIYWYE